MNPQFEQTQVAQEIQKDDINGISKNAARADDRVLFELLRTLPYDVSGPQKVILPYGVSGFAEHGSVGSTALVHGSGAADARVRVMPFRAVVSTTDATPTADLVRNLHSARFADASGSDPFATLTISANPAADPLWMLIYAAVTPMADDAPVDRRVKDVSTHVISPINLVVNKLTTVALGTTYGTAAATPTRPSLPADAAGTYYVALAYIYVPASFTAGTQVLREYIYEVAPCIPLHPATGVVCLAPANQSHAPGGAVDVNQSGPTAAQRPGGYLPSTMVGGEVRIIPLQFGLGAPSGVSHVDGDVIDDSTDWRFRLFHFAMQGKVGTTTAAAFPFDRRLTGAAPAVSALGNTVGSSVHVGFGQSFVDDTAGGLAWPAAVVDGHGLAAYATGTQLATVGGAGEGFGIYVRNTDGALVVKKSLNVTGQILVWLWASSPYSNFGTV